MMPDTPAPDDFDRSSEVSLRDLYLVLLRGLPFILLLAFIGGGVAYFLNAQRKPVFAAESTVLVTPPPIQIQGDETISFSPINEVSFQTYETLARSQTVLRDAVARVEGVKIAPNQLLALGTLRQLFGPQRVGDVAPLSVIHRVRNGNPERAALLADAWAQSTLKEVRESLFSSLRPVDETTAREVARLQKNVEEVEARIQAFAAQDKGPLLEAELEGLTRQITDGRSRQGELTREIAATVARIRALERQLAANQTAGQTGTTQNANIQGAATLSPAFLDVLAAQQVLRGADETRARARFTPSAQLSRTFEAALAESEVLSNLLEGNESEFVNLVRTLYTGAVGTLEDTLAEAQEVTQRAARTQAQGALELALLGYASAQTQVQTEPQAQTTQPQTTQPQTTQPQPAHTPPATATPQGNSVGQNESALALLSAAELRRERVALAGMRAERADLTRELGGYTGSAATIQKQLATLDQRRDRLDRELENVLASYNTVAGLQSSISYLTELAPTNARILSQASVPTSPSGPRRAFNTGLVAVTSALVGLVFVFLRAAIRRPKQASRKATA